MSKPNSMFRLLPPERKAILAFLIALSVIVLHYVDNALSLWIGIK